MSNRYFNQFRYSLEKVVRDLWMDVSFGASGAPTLNRGKGIQSITRTATGAYTIQLGAPSGSIDTYQKLLSMHNQYIGTIHDSTALLMLIVEDDANSSGQIKIKFVVAGTPGTGVDPASGDEMLFQLSLSDSYAP